MYINALDMARFGYLTLRRGKWKDRQLLSERPPALAPRRLAEGQLRCWHSVP